MKRIITTLILAVAVPHLVFGQPDDKKSSFSGKARMSDNEKATQEILNLQQVWLNGLLKGDPSAVKPVLAEDYLATVQNGDVVDKSQTLANIKPPNPTAEPLAVSGNDSKIRFYGNTAVSTGRLSLKSQAGSQTVRYTITFVKQQGKWQAVSSHVSAIAQP